MDNTKCCFNCDFFKGINHSLNGMVVKPFKGICMGQKGLPQIEVFDCCDKFRNTVIKNPKPERSTPSRCRGCKYYTEINKQNMTGSCKNMNVSRLIVGAGYGMDCKYFESNIEARNESVARTLEDVVVHYPEDDEFIQWLANKIRLLPVDIHGEE